MSPATSIVANTRLLALRGEGLKIPAGTKETTPNNCSKRLGRNEFSTKGFENKWSQIKARTQRQILWPLNIDPKTGFGMCERTYEDLLPHGQDGAAVITGRQHSGEGVEGARSDDDGLRHKAH